MHVRQEFEVMLRIVGRLHFTGHRIVIIYRYMYTNGLKI